MIPISLVVTLDIVRFVQASLIQWDTDLIHADKKATVNTSNLNDELAMVEYIFSDKTGTLTENIMIFKKASINGSIFDDSGEAGSLSQLIKDPVDDKSKKFARHFLYILALAHSCQFDELEGEFKSASPDEEALCLTAQKNNFVFKGREGNMIKLEIFGEAETYELLVENLFTSERSRMSVIVRSPSGKIYLYLKGADSVVPGLLKKSHTNRARLEKTLNDVDQFSRQGLRTLLLAYKSMTEEEFKTFWKDYNEANNLIEGRAEAVEDVLSCIERDLTLVGATGIEDTLQNGVPQTIANLRRAGIKIWVITGDKQETAINIGYSTNLFSSEADLVVINADSSEKTGEALHTALQRFNQGDTREKPFSIVIDGQTLTYVLTDHRQPFLDLAIHCQTAICNRVNPLQKAELVHLIQSSFSTVCLSVGDGGNDVSMIQQAEIGVGIKGREGSQAARAADFAISQFSHLEKLLLVHGRYCLLRNTKVIYYSFYKNAAVFLIIAWYSFFNGFSGKPIYGDWIMTFYNIIFTSLPVLAVGIFEKDLQEHIILRNPQIYQAHKKLNLWSLFFWMSTAIVHSLFIFWICWAIFALGGEVIYDAYSTGFRVFGTYVITVGFHVVLAKLLLETEYWVIWTVVGFLLSLVGFYLWMIMESYIISDYLNVFVFLLATPSLWLGLVLTIPATLLIDFSIKYIRRQMFPVPAYILQEKYENKRKTNNQEEECGLLHSGVRVE